MESNKEQKINELLARIQVRSEVIGYLRTANESDKTRIRLIEEGVKHETISHDGL